ncbi:MAG: DUF502 domain-containing protein [Dehalococcoidales bacterium]|nr:MAG: DUF502 domain-containing protein [Dehalococcoidales bacterium]
MNENKISIWKWTVKKLRTHFFTGVVTTIPLGITVWLLVWFFVTIDNILQPVITAIFGRPITGLGFGITIVLIFIIGVIASNVIGKRLIGYGEAILPFLPVFRQLYTGLKQITEGFTAPERTGYMQVVLVEFPRKGMRVIGFLTNELGDEPENKLLTIFIPTSPNPTSGYLQLVKEEEVVRTNISVENALKMVISAGRVSPKEVVNELPISP